MSKLPTQRTSVDQFLSQVEKLPKKSDEAARLIFGLDATASREPMWDLATQLHNELFNTASEINLEVQLVYYRGFNEFHVSKWSKNAGELRQEMTRVRCLGGMTQINRFLNHVQREASSERLRAAVFIGDACEESPTEILSVAGQLGLMQIPIFAFQEGHDLRATQVFSGMAARSGGAHIPFAPGSAQELRELLNAVAQFASGGLAAIAKLKGPVGIRLLQQLKK
ncbi:MAG: VWA domain-containing protein [Gammaproteobacteria bacterium]|nr:VWA domain-containing protein [Gammaproteobacteria bacterium]